jgi:hypothetical protein
VPVYEYKGEKTGKIVEEFFLSWRDATQEFERDGERFVRIPSRLATPVVVDDARKRLRSLAKRGVVPVEPGMDRDAKNARKAREERETKARQRVIAETLSQV